MQIPNISDERLAELVARIRPVVRQDDQLFYIKPVDPRKIAFTWDPKLDGRAHRLARLVSVRTLHTYGYYGMFKPSIAECLAQMPEEIADNAVAFEITESPSTAEDLRREQEALDEGFHVAETVFYGSVGSATADVASPRTVWERLEDDD